MKFEGKITYLSPEISVGKGEKITKKKVVCLEETGDLQYPNRIAVDFIGDDRISLLSGLQEGMVIEVLMNTAYNRFVKESGEESIFNSIKGWKVNIVDSSTDPINSKNDELPF